MEPKELRRILELINKAYEEAGRKLETAVVVANGEQTLVIDKREPEEVN